MKRRPLYRVGDHVHLKWPGYDGRYYVSAVYRDGDMMRCGTYIKTSDGRPCYYLGFGTTEEKYTVWEERLMKLVHTPSVMSYNDLIKSARNPGGTR